MNVPFISNPLALLALLILPSWAIVAKAQTPAPTVPAASVTDAAPAPFRSAFEGYQPYTEEKIVRWKEANDNVGRIGGWREYAKEAQQPQASGAAAQSDPHAGPAKPAPERP